MPDPNCRERGCIHAPGFVVVCEGGYSEQMALDSVGAGWSGLVREAMGILAGRASIEQVKEKFGGLRVYFRANSDVNEAEDDDLHERIADICRRSLSTCERCGAAGSMHVRGSYYQTLCARDAKTEGFQPARGIAL